MEGVGLREYSCLSLHVMRRTIFDLICPTNEVNIHINPSPCQPPWIPQQPNMFNYQGHSGVGQVIVSCASQGQVSGSPKGQHQFTTLLHQNIHADSPPLSVTDSDVYNPNETNNAVQ